MKDPHEIKMFNKVKDKLKLSGPAWRELLNDFKEGTPKSVICHKFKIKSSYYKIVKKIINNEV
jgi:hypothetical protein